MDVIFMLLPIFGWIIGVLKLMFGGLKKYIFVNSLLSSYTPFWYGVLISPVIEII